MAATYLDSSALVKLAVEEPESGALRRYLRRRRPMISSALARTEVLRALLLEGDEGVARGRTVLTRVELIRVNDRILNAAGMLLPTEVRSLDSIHLATAQQLGTDLGRVITYDERMLDACGAPRNPNGRTSIRVYAVLGHSRSGTCRHLTIECFSRHAAIGTRRAAKASSIETGPMTSAGPRPSPIKRIKPSSAPA